MPLTSFGSKSSPIRSRSSAKSHICQDHPSPNATPYQSIHPSLRVPLHHRIHPFYLLPSTFSTPLLPSSSYLTTRSPPQKWHQPAKPSPLPPHLRPNPSPNPFASPPTRRPPAEPSTSRSIRSRGIWRRARKCCWCCEGLGRWWLLSI